MIPLRGPLAVQRTLSFLAETHPQKILAQCIRAIFSKTSLIFTTLQLRRNEDRCICFEID